jgi:hypothetical protein
MYNLILLNAYRLATPIEVKWDYCKKKLSNTLSFILNVLSKQKLDQVLTHSVWVEYEIYGTQQIWEL